jgi:hypothetical protein
VPNLIRSRCYAQSGGTLSCITCHDPHKDLETSAGHYESRCLRCHPASTPMSSQTNPGANPSWSPCPVSPRGRCLDCHMPKVRDAVPRAVFTDHRIRIHHDGPSRSSNDTLRSQR